MRPGRVAKSQSSDRERSLQHLVIPVKEHTSWPIGRRLMTGGAVGGKRETPLLQEKKGQTLLCQGTRNNSSGGWSPYHPCVMTTRGELSVLRHQHLIHRYRVCACCDGDGPNRSCALSSLVHSCRALLRRRFSLALFLSVTSHEETRPALGAILRKLQCFSR